MAEPTRRQSAPTIVDVARLAGVSKGTVSKVLNGRPGIGLATRIRVESAVDELGFQRNPFAGGSVRGRTGTVGLLTNDLEGRFSLPILMGAEDALGSGELSVFLCDARGDEIRERYHLAALIRRRVDGLIVVGNNSDPRPSLGDNLGIPVVYAFSPSLSEKDVSVVTDDVTAGELAVQHLLSVGKRRIAYAGGDLFLAAQARPEGARNVLEAAGLDFATPPVFGPWSEAWGRKAARMLLNAAPDIDAILCGSDYIARGVLDGVKRTGRSVPEDVAVMGHDNREVLAAESEPPLTTIDMNLGEVGRLAAQLIFKGLDEEEIVPGEHKVPGRVILRESTH